MTFSFTREGVTYRVHSEVGDDKPACVVVEQDQQPQSLDCSDEADPA